MSTSAVLRHRRDTAANWTSTNPVLYDGQLGFETDTRKSKLGDGTTAWNSLSYTSATASISDGDKGDVVVSGGGSTWNLDTVGSFAGSYGSGTSAVAITVDNKGRITAISGVTIAPAWSNIASKPTTLSGFGITDAQPLDSDLTDIAALTANGLLRKTAGTWGMDSSTYLTANQTITLSGDLSGSGSTSISATIASDAVTYAKIQNVSATDRILGRVTAGAGDIEEITCTAAGRAILDDADAAAQRATLGLGTAATQNTGAFEVPLTFSTGLTRSTNTITVNTSQNIGTLSNLTSNGFVKTSGGTGTLSVDTTTYQASNASLTQIAGLADPNADRLLFWDDSAGSYAYLTLGTNLSITGTTIDAAGGGGVSDGDKGDITVSGTGATWTIDSGAVSYSKIQNVSATNKILGRVTAGAGTIEEIDCTAAGRALLDDADATAQRTTLGLGSIAVKSASGWATLTVGTSAPGSPATGDLWVDTN